MGIDIGYVRLRLGTARRGNIAVNQKHLVCNRFGWPFRDIGL